MLHAHCSTPRHAQYCICITRSTASLQVTSRSAPKVRTHQPHTPHAFPLPLHTLTLLRRHRFMHKRVHHWPRQRLPHLGHHRRCSIFRRQPPQHIRACCHWCVCNAHAVIAFSSPTSHQHQPLSCSHRRYVHPQRWRFRFGSGSSPCFTQHPQQQQQQPRISPSKSHDCSDGCCIGRHRLML